MTEDPAIPRPTIDLPANALHVAAMMPPSRWESFDTAEILSVERGAPREDA